MNKQKMIVCMLAMGVAGLAQADTVFSGGVLSTAGNWDNGLPGAGNNGTVNSNGTMGSVSQADTTFSGATITVGGGAALTIGSTATTGDLPAGNTAWIINNATVTIGDDLFSNNSIITLNAGSVVNATDDFEAQSSGGALIINGGTHSTGDSFGMQTGTSTLSFLGGTMTAGMFRFRAGTGSMTLGGDATATATGTTTAANIAGDVNILSGWSGSLTAANFSGDNWKDAIVGAWSLNGTAVDSAAFDANFVVTNGGQTLAIPEPATMGMVAVFGGAIMFIRRRFMI